MFLYLRNFSLPRRLFYYSPVPETERRGKGHTRDVYVLLASSQFGITLEKRLGYTFYGCIVLNRLTCFCRRKFVVYTVPWVWTLPQTLYLVGMRMSWLMWTQSIVRRRHCFPLQRKKNPKQSKWKFTFQLRKKNIA